jgi:hypothetical protein
METYGKSEQAIDKFWNDLMIIVSNRGDDCFILRTLVNISGKYPPPDAFVNAVNNRSFHLAEFIHSCISDGMSDEYLHDCVFKLDKYESNIETFKYMTDLMKEPDWEMFFTECYNEGFKYFEEAIYCLSMGGGDQYDFSVVMFGLETNNINIVKNRFKHGTNITLQWLDELFRVASCLGRLNFMRYFVKKGARDFDGATEELVNHSDIHTDEIISYIDKLRTEFEPLHN